MRVIEWTAWPLRRKPGRGAFAAAIVAGSVWGVWSWTGDGWLTAIAIAVLTFSVGSFFVPTGYRLSPEGVEVSRPWRARRRPWRDFRRVLEARDLLVLSPFTRATWLDSVRGETLLLEGNADEVRQYVDAHLEAMVGSGSSR